MSSAAGIIYPQRLTARYKGTGGKVVAAVAGKRIVVLKLSISTDTAAEVDVFSGTSNSSPTKVIDGGFFAANTGHVVNFDPVGAPCVTGEDLSVATTAANTKIYVQYALEDN